MCFNHRFPAHFLGDLLNRFLKVFDRCVLGEERYILFILIGGRLLLGGVEERRTSIPTLCAFDINSHVNILLQRLMILSGFSFLKFFGALTQSHSTFILPILCMYYSIHRVSPTLQKLFVLMKLVLESQALLRLCFFHLLVGSMLL